MRRLLLLGLLLVGCGGAAPERPSTPVDETTASSEKALVKYPYAASSPAASIASPATAARSSAPSEAVASS